MLVEIRDYKKWPTLTVHCTYKYTVYSWQVQVLQLRPIRTVHDIRLELRHYLKEAKTLGREMIFAQFLSRIIARQVGVWQIFCPHFLWKPISPRPIFPRPLLSSKNSNFRVQKQAEQVNFYPQLLNMHKSEYAIIFYYARRPTDIFNWVEIFLIGF